MIEVQLEIAEHIGGISGRLQEAIALLVCLRDDGERDLDSGTLAAAGAAIKFDIAVQEIFVLYIFGVAHWWQLRKHEHLLWRSGNFLLLPHFRDLILDVGQVELHLL